MRYIIILTVLSVISAGCATIPSHQITTIPLPEPTVHGIYHGVAQGQTLWRIAKAYNVDITEIIQANNIPEPFNIDAGQLIFIPGATREIKGDLRPPSLKSRKGYVWPLEGRIICYYGSIRDNVVNKGIDIKAESGTMVIAARSGKVVFCDERVKGMGKVIIIDHGDGYSTLYGHNSTNLVKCGDYVSQSQSIAQVGKTGRAKVPMLHFQIRKAHKPQNPFYYLP